jgi:hypothetical protein
MATPISIPGNTSIIPVNTTTIKKTLTLPSVQANPGRILIIKDMYGAASTQTINISTTGSDTIEKTYNNAALLSTSYGAWMFTNDGLSSWFLMENYQNTLSTLNRNQLIPFSPLAFSLTVVGSIFTTNWLPSINASSYAVSYYYTLIPQTTGGTLIQTVSAGTALTNTINYTAQAIYSYYAILTTTNANGTSVILSSLVTPILLLAAPTNVILTFATTLFTCIWTPVLNATNYTLTVYQNPDILYQSITGLTVPFYIFQGTTIDGLLYYATVQAINPSSQSPLGVSALTLSTLIPAQTSAVLVEPLGINVLCVWVAVANATSYTVNFYSNATPTTAGGTLIETVTAAQTTVNQVSTATLINGTYIYATVVAVNQYGTPLSAITSSGTVGPIATPPLAPATVTMSIPGAYTQALWTAATNAASYIVNFYQTNSSSATGGTFFETVSTSSLTAINSKLLVNGLYYYATVQSVNPYGTSGITVTSNQLTQITIAVPPLPPA